MTLYAPRMFKRSGIHTFGDIALKCYTITVKGQVPVDIDRALPYARQSLAGSLLPWLQHKGVGYLIYHAGEDANWLLTRLWMQGDIVSGLIAGDHGHGLNPIPTPFVECVWEAVICEFERNCWVKHMMIEAPDPDAWLMDQLPEGLH